MQILVNIVIFFLFSVTAAYGTRIKDMTDIQGTRDNQLVGYGIVIGLAGVGDSSIDFTNQALQNALKKFGVNTANIASKNIAAVMITADIGPFSKPGSRIDVTVSSIGNAKTLQGGVLLQTPLEAADNTVYAVAQGPIAIGGFLGGSDGGSSVQQNHPTVGRITGGAIVEREIPSDILCKGSINLLLMNPDFITAVRIADALNVKYPASSQALNSGTVSIKLPFQYLGQETNFIAAIGGIEVVPDVTARVVVNERTGTIVATANVRISTVAISHGSLTISISNTANVSQPNALSQTGTTEVTNSQATSVNEVKGGFTVVHEFPTIERLTTALNALGVTTREMMSILQSIKCAGALQAELVIK